MTKPTTTHHPRRFKHLTDDEVRQILEFARTRVTVDQFCNRMGIHPSTYATVLIRHGLRKGRTSKDDLVRQWKKQSAAVPP